MTQIIDDSIDKINLSRSRSIIGDANTASGFRGLQFPSQSRYSSPPRAFQENLHQQNSHYHKQQKQRENQPPTTTTARIRTNSSFVEYARKYKVILTRFQEEFEFMKSKLPIQNLPATLTRKKPNIKVRIIVTIESFYTHLWNYRPSPSTLKVKTSLPYFQLSWGLEGSSFVQQSE